MKLLYVLCLLPVVHGINIYITAETEPKETNSDGIRVQYGCDEQKKLPREDWGNATVFPHKCRYFCNRGSVPVLYGYYEQFTPCWDGTTERKTGTCIYSRVTKPSIRCDTNQPAVTSPPKTATMTELPS
uniref:Putative conserved secreted protein n=1 Tax=Ornithodoros turicata TaxID=34597 RepID=A0A2R5LEW8_9ACAR